MSEPAAPSNPSQASVPGLQPQQIAQLMQRPDIPRIYANGFAVVQSASDISILLLSHGLPMAIVSMSFIGAKSINEEMDKALVKIEDILKQKIPTLTEVAAKMSESKGPNYVVRT